VTNTKQQALDARPLLEAELRKHLDSNDTLQVNVAAFRNFLPVDEIVEDPLTLTWSLEVYFSHVLDTGQRYAVRQVVSPQMVMDSLAMPMIAKHLVSEWQRQRDEAISAGPPAES
jgi:hypothetical protein